jgi:BirA family biotin operon repressor/biotin-[acetyl-CoA-carboxylase] ligase
MIPEEVELHACENELLKKIVYKEKTGSTQVLAKKIAESGEGEGILVVCEEQESGYGRLRREWKSPKGGIWFSLVLRPGISPEKASLITFAMSMAICRALKKRFNITAGIKWPNDICLGTKKLSGILTEMSAEVGRLNWVVVGVGINVNNQIPHLLRKTAVSLKAFLKKEVKRAEFLGAILDEFKTLYKGVLVNGFSVYSGEYNRLSSLNGKKISVDTGIDVISGTAQKVDNHGYLWVRKETGDMEKIVAGDITTLKK